MKIAIISSGFFPVIDGVTVTLFHRLRYLSQYGHQVLLFCPDYSSLGSIYPDWQKYTGEIFPNVRIINLPSTPFMGLEFEQNVSQKSYSVVLQELQLFQPDIIHVDEPERLWLGFLKRAGLDFSRQAKIPCVSFFHTNFIEYLEDYLPLPQWGLKILQFLAKYHRNWIYNGYDLTLISSKTTAHKVTSLGFKNVVIADLLGVDIEPYKNLVKESNYFATKYNIKDINQKLKLVFLGRLTPDKGWHFTLDALTRFSSQINFDNLAFIIAGEGTMKAEIQQKIRNLTSHIYLLDRILPEHIPPLLINSDIYVTTSEKETKGLTILEALAAGLPILAPHAGGIIDTIQNNYNGLLFTPKNAVEFIQKLNLLLENMALRQKISANAKVSIHRGWEESVNNLINIWQETRRSVDVE
jgi:glycosyltransferase involved in cell wall biosynthesis